MLFEVLTVGEKIYKYGKVKSRKEPCGIGLELEIAL